jgi:hypothetical protein
VAGDGAVLVVAEGPLAGLAVEGVSGVDDEDGPACLPCLLVVLAVSCGLWAAVLVPLILWGPL